MYSREFFDIFKVCHRVLYSIEHPFPRRVETSQNIWLLMSDRRRFCVTRLGCADAEENLQTLSLHSDCELFQTVGKQPYILKLRRVWYNLCITPRRKKMKLLKPPFHN